MKKLVVFMGEQARYIFSDVLIGPSSRIGSKAVNMLLSLLRRTIHPNNLFKVGFRLRLARLLGVFLMAGLYMLRRRVYR